MKKLYTFLAIAFVVFLSACSSDDNEWCEYIYTGSTIKDSGEYFVTCINQNSGEWENIKVAEEIYAWIMRGNLKNGDCFDVDKYKFVE